MAEDAENERRMNVKMCVWIEFLSHAHSSSLLGELPEASMPFHCWLFPIFGDVLFEKLGNTNCNQKNK